MRALTRAPRKRGSIAGNVAYALLVALLLARPDDGFAQRTAASAQAPVVEPLFAAPKFPRAADIPPSEIIFDAYPAAGLVVDTTDREAVRVFYNGLFSQPDTAPINWTGTYSTCSAGGTDQLYQDAVALRVNWYRAMAGIPATISLYAPYSQQAQQAALVMSVNGQLSHTPPSSWTCWSQTASDAASKSNLSLGSVGPSAVTGYMRDPGTGNSATGHRRWILYPQTQNMGTGDVPAATGGAGANALWVMDSNIAKPRPAVRDDFIAWPPKGYVPYPVVFGRWSLSHSTADFTSATVTVTKAGVNVPVSREALSNGFGENTIVWLLQGVNDSTTWPKPAGDEAYVVTVANVLLGGSARTFTYTVTVFDPDTPTPGAAQTIVGAPASGTANSAFAANIAAMPNASSYQLALFRLSALPSPITPPAATPVPWTYATGPAGAYNPIEAASFHLYHADFATQAMTYTPRLYVGQNASLSFSSMFTFAASGQVARVQVSLDDGGSWRDVYSEPGSIQNASSTKTVDLAAFAGRFARVRFVFTYQFGTSAYTDTDSGWYFNNIVFTDVNEMVEGQTVGVPASVATANLSAGTQGNYVLAARTEYQGMYFTDWGPTIALQLAAGAGMTATNFTSGWNLLGNGAGDAIAVSGVLGDANKVSTVWKWVAATSKWAFYAPSLAGQALTDYAAGKGYDVLTTINRGEGYWVNARTAFAAQMPVGTAVSSTSFQTIPSGWNLLAIGDNKTPSQFNGALGATPPATGSGAPTNITTLWAWDTVQANWYFYAPSLENTGGLATYIASKGYLNFGTKVLDPSMGFWVNKP